MKKRPDDAEIIVIVDLTYYKQASCAEVIANLSLFKLIRVTQEERLRNLMLLLNRQATEVRNFQKIVVECQGKHDNSLAQDGPIL